MTLPTTPPAPDDLTEAEKKVRAVMDDPARWQRWRARYDFAQYLSISGPIERSRRSYYRAFVLSETDGGDLTYFLIHQLGVLDRATTELIEHVTARAKRLNLISQTLAGATALNHRQQAALAHLLRSPGASVSVAGHATSHGVTYLTARKDLQSMAADGWLDRVRIGHTDRYSVSQEAQRRVK